MHTTRTIPRHLETTRLDPEYYHPMHLKDVNILESFGSEPMGTGGKFFAGPFGSKLPSNLYLNEGVPLFRVGNVGSMKVNLHDMAYLHPSVHQELKASEVGPGDLLIVKASVGEKICKVPDWMPKANITQHIIAVRSNGHFDTDYLSAFLFGQYGQRQLIRRSLGSIIQYLGVNDARTVLVPKLDKSTQIYIGDKVRRAERLRAEARESKKKAREVFNEALDWSNHITAKILSRRVAPNKLGGRLDLNFNSPRKYELLDHFESRKIRTEQLDKLVDISAMIGWKGLTTEHYVEVGPWLLRGVEFDKGIIDFDSLVCVEKAKYDEQPQIHLRAGDVALTKDGTLGKAICIPRLSKEIAAGSTVARLRPKNDFINPFYLEFVLNHEVLQIQIQSYATGLAQPHITQEWIAQLLIPRIERERSISSFIMQHHEYAVASKFLVTAAKILVEALIEGQITESDLITAQKALEAGDREPDRTILSHLTRKGMDVPGELPLFPDLDRLYDALDEIDTIQEAS